jgi:hypothetical protein
MRGAATAALVLSIAFFSCPVSAAEKGTVTFVVRDDRGNDLDAKITLDDDATLIPLGRQQALEPGIHDVHWSIASGTAGVQKLTVIEGQQGRIFQIVASVPPPLAPAPPVIVPAPAGPPPETSSSGSRGSVWPYIVLGGGATLAVSSAVFELVAMNEDSDANHYFWTSTRADLGPGERESFREAGRSHYDAAKSNETIAITCGILAVTAVSVAVTWLLVSRK